MDKVLKECSVQSKRPEFEILQNWNDIKQGFKQSVVNPGKDPIVFPKGTPEGLGEGMRGHGTIPTFRGLGMGIGPGLPGDPPEAWACPLLA